MNGWILDLYPIEKGGVVVWIIDDHGQRRCFTLQVPITFYASGLPARLSSLQSALHDQQDFMSMLFTQRRDIFKPDPVEVLAITAESPTAGQRLFNWCSNAYPDLTYYDADIHVALRLAALYGIFPLCYCAFEMQGEDGLKSVQTLDSPWNWKAERPELRTLELELEHSPHQAPPVYLLVRWGSRKVRLSFAAERPLLVNLAGIINQFDPDIILAYWGDSWLLPTLLELSTHHHIPLPLNRDTHITDLASKPERTYFSYGQVIHRDQQLHLYGRLHIDPFNAMLFHDYGMEGIYELGRVTGLLLQTVARVSPGSGISAMQMVTALRQQILVPWHKQQAEEPRTVLDLIRSDQGGMVYQPIIGLHRHVAEIDFSSMYPSIMVHHNISPETRRSDGSYLEDSPPGLIPLTLDPLLKKRLLLKQMISTLSKNDPRRKIFSAWVSAHKALLVTGFGYLGYKNARFGRIEAHEAVTAFGRVALLQAKEAAEDMGFMVLHMYVDGLWVQKEGVMLPEQIQPLLAEITRRTGLPIALDGIFDWIAFLSSRADSRVPVANRFFWCVSKWRVKT